jgi:hypothetical protein
MFPELSTNQERLIRRLRRWTQIEQEHFPQKTQMTQIKMLNAQIGRKVFSAGEKARPQIAQIEQEHFPQITQMTQIRENPRLLQKHYLRKSAFMCRENKEKFIHR